MPQPDMTQLLQLIRSPAGQQLLTFLQTNGGTAAREAAGMAASGDLAAAQKALAPLLKDPALRALLQQLGGTP